MLIDCFPTFSGARIPFLPRVAVLALAALYLLSRAPAQLPPPA